MTDVLIKRELLEQIDETAICDGTDATISDDLFTQLVAALAAPRQPDSNPFFDNRIARELLEDREKQWPMSAPRQPEGDGLEVVESLHVWRATNRFGDTCHFGDAGCARAWAGAEGKVDRIELKPVPELYDVNHSDAAEVSATEIKVVAWAHCADATRLLCDLGKQRSVPGHYADEFTIPLCRLSDHLRAIAELRDRLDVMTQCADNYSRMFEESAEECEHLKACQENAMLHMTGLVAERDTLRQQLAGSDAALRESRANDMAAMAHLADMRQQRDKLAGLLRALRETTGEYAWDADLEQRIDAALAEVEK